MQDVKNNRNKENQSKQKDSFTEKWRRKLNLVNFCLTYSVPFVPPITFPSTYSYYPNVSRLSVFLSTRDQRKQLNREQTRILGQCPSAL